MASASTGSSPSGRYNKQELIGMKRSDLQKVFKTEGLKGANQKSEILIDVLLSHFGNAVTRGQNGAQLSLSAVDKSSAGLRPGTPKNPARGLKRVPELRRVVKDQSGPRIAELQAQIAALSADLRVALAEPLALAARVEMLEARDAEWTERLAAVEAKWQESMARVTEQLDAFRRAPSLAHGFLANINEEGRRPRHASVPATPVTRPHARLTFPPSVTSLGKRRRDDFEADGEPSKGLLGSLKPRVISTASALDAGDVDVLLEDSGLRTPPRATSRQIEPRTPSPGVHALPSDLPSPSPAQKKRSLSGLGHASTARLVSASLVPPPSPRADRLSPAPRLHARVPSTRIDALFGPERTIIPLEPMHAPFNDPSSTPTAIDRAIDEPELPSRAYASPVIPDLLGPELSRLSPFPAPTPAPSSLQTKRGNAVPPTPPAMSTLFGTERSRDTRFGDEPY